MDQEVKEVAALSRPIKPGMLYDCRNDSFVPGVTLWNNDELTKNLLENKRESADFAVLLSDRIEDKEKALDINAELSMSLMGGFISVEGSAKFLMEKTSKSNTSRVTLQYKTMSKFVSLSMDQLGNPQHKQVFDQGTATHVCTGVDYGVDAFFVFEKKIENESSSKEIGGKLEAVVKELSISGGIDLEGKDIEKKFLEEISCRYIGDYIPETIPTSYEEAKNILQELSKNVKSIGQTAKKIYLYPLVKLDNGAAKLERSINDNTISRVKELVQSYTDLKNDAQSCIDKDIVKSSPFLEKEALKLNDTINLACDMFLSDVKPVLPLIRGGKAEESALLEILNKWQKSRYSPEVLRQHFKVLHENIGLVKILIDYAETNGADIKVGAGISSYVGVNDEVIALTFNEKAFQSKALEHTLMHLRREQDDDFDVSDSPPICSIESQKLEELNQLLNLFVEYAQKNADKKFVVCSDNNCPGESVAYTNVRTWYKASYFKLPSIPSQPTYTEGSKTTTSLKIQISPSEKGQEDVTGYKLTVYETGVEMKIIDVPKDSISQFLVEDLHPGMDYSFKVQSVSQAGSSPKSCMSMKVFLEPAQFNTHCALKMVVNDKPNDWNGDVTFLAADDQEIFLMIGLHPELKKLAVGNSVFIRGSKDDTADYRWVSATYPEADDEKKYTFEFSPTGFVLKCNDTVLITIPYEELTDDKEQFLSSINSVKFKLPKDAGPINLQCAQNCQGIEAVRVRCSY